MALLDDKQLLARIDEFLERTGMKPTRFGRDAMGEPSLIDTLRKGRSLSLKNANKVISFMAAHDDAVATADRDATETGNETALSGQAVAA